MPGTYHHGNLRAELVRVAADLIADKGLAAFSVAEIARRAHVSPGAPYRHFQDRDDLLAAVATDTAHRLATSLRAATEPAPTPAAALAAAAGAYTAHTMERRAGMDLLHSEVLRASRHAELHDAVRTATDHFLLPCLTLTPTPADALDLMEQLFTQAHGYATFWLDGVFAKHGYTADQVVAKSTAAALVVIKGHGAR